MEYEGIITGIGSVDKNQILPELDAIVNKVIFNSNGILDGLRIVNNGLTKGVCLLCGYRGVLEEDIPDLVDDWEDEMGGTDDYSEDFYVYGKFTINYDTQRVDSFEIVTTNELHSEPSSITGSGVYWLKLYTYSVVENVGTWTDDAEIIQYPLRSEYAETTTVLLPNGVIGANATGTTQTVNDNSTKPATTEYVHNQIEEEIAYDTYQDEMTYTDVSQNIKIQIDIKRKAKYCIFTINIIGLNEDYYGRYGLLAPTTLFTLPIGFVPKIATSLIVYIGYDDGNGHGGTNEYETIQIDIDTNGWVTCHAVARPSSGSTVCQANSSAVTGYETN